MTNISGTAFLVNESRAKRKKISKDTLADKWIDPLKKNQVSRLWSEFYKEVYQFDDIVVSLRNRHYLKLINSFIASESKNKIIVNIGAGFTSYPYIANGTSEFIEIDQSEVINYKKKRTKELISKEQIEKKNISFIPCDLQNGSDLKNMKNILYNQVLERGKTSLILLEGVSYYISKPYLNSLFALIKEIQIEKSIFAFDFWKPELKTNKVFEKQQIFFEHKYNFAPQNYTFLDESFLDTITGYKMLDLVSTFGLARKYLKQKQFYQDRNQTLVEYYVTLQRK